MKNAVFADVTPYGSCKNRRFRKKYHGFLSLWWWRRCVPPKRRFLQEPCQAPIPEHCILLTVKYSGKRPSRLCSPGVPSSREVLNFTRREFRRWQQPLVHRLANLVFTRSFLELNCHTNVYTNSKLSLYHGLSSCKMIRHNSHQLHV
jgi:hypothetical protein